MRNKKILADIIALAHGIVVLVMLLSLPIAILVPGSRFFILIFAFTILGSWVFGRGCPLRSWELNIRKKYNLTGVYQGMFITHYVNKYLGTNFSDFIIRLIIYPYMFLVIILAFFMS